MKNNINNILFTICLSIGLFTSCVNDSFQTPADNCVSPDLTKNKEVQDIYNSTPSTPALYTNDDVIEAIVTSSDEGGNFFKTLCLTAVDGSRGFSMSIDDNNIYTRELQPGKKVFVKLKDLYVGRPGTKTMGLVLGAKPSVTEPTLVNRIPTINYKKFIIPTCQVVDEETIVKKLTLSQLNNDTYLNSLVEIDNVQFESEGVTYGNIPSSQFDKNENISDGTISFVTRTSKFSNFAGHILPLGRGKIRGVLTKFSGAYQLIIRNERDVQFNNPRVDYAPPIVGNSIIYSGTLNENFTDYAVAQTNFPKYINDANINSRYWQLKIFNGNKYIEMSSFGGGGVTARTYFMIPVDFTAANTMTFKKQIRFNKGIALKVHYIKSSDYTPGNVVNPALLTDITSSFNIPYPAIDSSDNGFTTVTTYTIPTTLTGNGYFVFEYSGTPTMTTTVQIDDIVIN